jgi:DNA polymerase I-like protein with 3'-5' exonuclease and polymerase domains|tara:strand:- start:710 stop:2602 length:1893 start_codon:yes stop_codon:yes gene_type:complete
MPQQMPMFTPDTSWAPPEVLPDLSSAKEIAVDLETRDPDLILKGPGWATNTGEVVGVSIATDGWSGYLPFGHQGGGNLEKEFVISWVKKQLSGSSDKIFHNAMYDVGWLRRLGITVNGTIHDTMIAAPLVNENRNRYSLDSLGSEYCGERKDETLLREAAHSFGVDPKAEMWKLPANYVGFYAEQDAVLTLKLWKVLKDLLDKEEVSQIYELERSLLPLLLEMRWKGVRVDENAAEKQSVYLKSQEQKLLSQIKKDYGVPVEVWNAKSISKAFDKAGLTYPRTPKTNVPSFTAQWLESHSHILPQSIVKARRYNKMRTTFIDKMIFEHSHNGRIHGQMHPLRSDDGGTVTGRFSYSTPNLQQVPARDPELGPLIRGLFIPEEGCLWGAFDYSQQEPRLTVHYASLTKQPGAQNAVEQYRDENADFHQIVADMANIPRKQAKDINLALSYGMGKKKLISMLNISDTEAEDLISKYHQRVPFVKALADSCMRNASNRGFITTLLGRKCRFNLFEPRNTRTVPLAYEEAAEKWGEENIVRSFTYKALNRLIQGSAADMTKKAMVNLYEAGYIPHIQVHDELDISVETKKQAKEIKEIMENCVQLEVPNVVDAELGKTWGEATTSYKEAFDERD